MNQYEHILSASVTGDVKKNPAVGNYRPGFIAM